MKIIKRNGNTTIYDDQKIIRSILKANESSGELIRLTEKEAANLAFHAMSRLTEDSEVISTKEIRDSVYAELCARELNETAKAYMDYKKTNG